MVALTAGEVYGTLEGFTAYCAKNGKALTGHDADAQSIALRRGVIEIDGFATRFPGQRADASQRLEWPRTNATYRDGTPIAAGETPWQVVEAQYEVAYLMLTDASQDNRQMDPQQVVLEDDLDGLKTRYNPLRDMTTVRMRRFVIEDKLASLLYDADDRRDVDEDNSFVFANIDGS